MGKYRRLSCALTGIIAALCFVETASAEPNFLGNVPVGTQQYDAIAQMQVQIPNSFNQATGQFTFSSVSPIIYSFTVTGKVDIWSAGASDNFNDQITNAAVGLPADGLNALRLEIVELTSVNVSPSTPAGAVITDVHIGDGMDGGTNNGPRFSTGGAAELAVDGSTATSFLNLFLDVTVTEPTYPNPLGSPFAPGNLFNKDVLHLEPVGTIAEFAPDGISYLMTAAFINMYAPSTHPFVMAVNAAYMRPANTDMVFARLVSADLQISDVQAIPEPGSYAIAGMGLLGLVGFYRFGRRSA